VQSPSPSSQRSSNRQLTEIWARWSANASSAEKQSVNNATVPRGWVRGKVTVDQVDMTQQACALSIEQKKKSISQHPAAVQLQLATALSRDPAKKKCGMERPLAIGTFWACSAGSGSRPGRRGYACRSVCHRRHGSLFGSLLRWVLTQVVTGYQGGRGFPPRPFIFTQCWMQLFQLQRQRVGGSLREASLAGHAPSGTRPHSHRPTWQDCWRSPGTV
jgi:hypothetical protein